MWAWPAHTQFSSGTSRDSERDQYLDRPPVCYSTQVQELDTHDSPAKWEAFLAGTERYTGNQGQEDRDVGWVPEILKIQSWHEF